MLHDSLHVVLLSFQSNKLSAITNDGAVNKKIKQFDIHNRYHRITGHITPQIAQAIIKQCDLVLGMRLHSLIMGVNADTPIVGISYDPKVTSLMKAGGLEKYCCTKFPPEATDVATKLELAWKNRIQISTKMSHFQELSSNAAKENTRLALNLISDTSPPPRKFAKQFPIEQLNIINNLDNLLEITKGNNLELISQVNSIQSDFSIIKQDYISQLKLLETELEKTKNDNQIARLEIDTTIVELEKSEKKIENAQIQLKEKTDELAILRSQLDKNIFE